MAVVNPSIASGNGLGTDRQGSSNAITITPANDVNFFRQNLGQGIAGPVAAGAGTVSSADLFNGSDAGVKVVVDITAIAGTSPTLTVKIEGKDDASGKYYTILASAALTAVGTTVLTVFPGAPVTANLFANDHLPAGWRITYIVGGTGALSVTATISASLLL